MSVAVTAEYKLFETRAKSVWKIFLGLLVAAVGGTLAVLFAYSAANPWLLVLAAAPLGYGCRLGALAWSGLFRRVVNDAPGTARWATMDDLKKAGVVGESVDPHHHIPCGSFSGVPVHDDSDRHAITFGSTRRGKGVGLLVPALAQIDESFVVLDPSGELAAITLPERAKKGLTLVINPFGVGTKTHPYLKSSGFNPYLNYAPGEPEFFARSCGIGESIVPRASINDAHWDQRSVQLTTVLGMWEKWQEKNGKVSRATMRHVMEMLGYPYTSNGGKNLKGVMQEICDPRNKHDQQMVRMATSFIADDEDKEVRGVIATTAGKAKALNDETLLADMDKHPMIDGKPFDFGMLKERLITVYIILPDEMFKTHAVWLRLIISSAINALKRTPPGDIHPIILLDEIGWLGYLESLDTAMGMIAKKGVKVWTVWQSLSQISRIYGDHGRETFVSGAGAKHAFRADDLETAKWLAELLGPRTEVITSYHTPSKPDASTSRNDGAAGFPLMNPTQIMNLPARTLICWIDRLPHPVKLDAPGYFDMPWIKGMAPNPYYVEKRKP